MTDSNPLKSKSRKTVRYLKDQGLITDEHAMVIALLESLCDEWMIATSSTQRGAISKEIRACLEALPKPEVKVSDEAQDFLASLGDAN